MREHTRVLTLDEYRKLHLPLDGVENPEALFEGSFGVSGGQINLPGGGTGTPSSGYNEAGDVFDSTVDGVLFTQLWAEFEETLNYHNVYRQELIGLLASPVSNIVEPFWNGIPDDVEFEEATEYGEPTGIRTPTPRFRGYPLRYYDLAVRYTWRFLAEAEADRIRALHNSALEKDLRLQYQMVMQALFDDTNTTVLMNNSLDAENDGIQTGQTVPVFRLYNADGEVPQRWKSYEHDGTHTHYLTTAGASLAPVDIETMEDELVHHGFKESGRAFVLLVNRAQGKTIRGFRQGVNSASYDFIEATDMATRDWITGPQPGPEWIGSYGYFLIREEDALPPDYMLALATAGAGQPANVVGVREHWNPAVKGLKLLGGPREGYPLIGSFYQHALGAGVQDRASAVVMKVTAGAYTVPTFI